MEHAGITLSIIIPVYNVMAYLRPCLDSLLNQTCPAGFSYEVLLADDGSTDGSGAVCEEYAKAFRQVRVLHRENGGQSAARNQAIRAAEGAWLAFVDSDDLVRPEFLAALAGELKDGRDVVLYNSYSTRDETIRAPFRAAQFADGLDGYLRRCIVEYPFVTAPWRYAVRRQFLMEQGLWFHEGIYHEDCEWCPKVLARAKTAAVCEQALYVYRDAPEQGRDSTCMNPARWAKRLDGFGQVVPALKAEATAFANDPVRRGFLLRSAALAWQQRLILAAAAGKLAEIAREETANRDLLAYTPKRFGLCLRLAGLRGGTQLYRKLWGEH